MAYFNNYIPKCIFSKINICTNNLLGYSFRLLSKFGLMECRLATIMAFIYNV